MAEPIARPMMEIVDSIRNLCSEVHEAGKAEGRKEVVEAVKSMGFTYLGKWFPFENFEDLWQAKLKEWGLSE